MAQGDRSENFACPKCKARYKIVRIKAPASCHDNPRTASGPSLVLADTDRVVKPVWFLAADAPIQKLQQRLAVEFTRGNRAPITRWRRRTWPTWRLWVP